MKNKISRMTKQRRIELLEREILRLDCQRECHEQKIEDLSRAPHRIYKALFPKAIDGYRNDMGEGHIHVMLVEIKRLQQVEITHP